MAAEWKDFEKVGDQHGRNTYNTPKMDVKKKKNNKGKSVQVDVVKDMYVKKQFRVYVLNLRRCSSSY